ncbi:hypothetical protein AB0H83_02120 [Dactylosporangium sp. NPDC050688]|uniref:hypothetical protein n=1 Tax=Dactylosporangium sp. NPDC050688 TaxID=3157217 RepID=UPI0033CC24DE
MTGAFLEHRRMLRGLAYPRRTRADRPEIAEPRRYLTRVVARPPIAVLRLMERLTPQRAGYVLRTAFERLRVANPAKLSTFGAPAS